MNRIVHTRSSHREQHRRCTQRQCHLYQEQQSPCIPNTVADIIGHDCSDIGDVVGRIGFVLVDNDNLVGSNIDRVNEGTEMLQSDSGPRCRLLLSRGDIAVDVNFNGHIVRNEVRGTVEFDTDSKCMRAFTGCEPLAKFSSSHAMSISMSR